MNIIEILNEIRDAKSPKAKKEVMEKYKSNDTLQKLIHYTYNPYKRYGITKKTFANYQKNHFHIQMIQVKI